MKNIKFFILLYLILLPYASVSYGVTDSWCSNGRYDKNIKPFPKPSFNKCPENARRTMTLKEVESYYLDGAGLEYLCDLNKNFIFGLPQRRDDYKAIKEMFLYKQDLVNSSCSELERIKLAKKKAIEDKQKEIAAKKITEDQARINALAEKKAEEKAKIRALAEKLAKKEIANQLKLKQKEEEAKQKALAVIKAKEDAVRKKAMAKKKAEKQAKQKTIAAKKAKEDKARNKALAKEKADELAKQKAIAAKKAEEDKARNKALAKEKADELAKQKAIAAKKAEEEKLQKKVLNEKIQKIKDEAKFIVATLKEYVTTDTNKLDILEVSELLENYNSEIQKGWSDNTVEKYEELYDYVQKDEGFIEFSADKKSKQLAAYNEEIRQLREYLTTSQSDLKAFITKNLGSNNAIKALKLAKETKKILKDFEVSQAMTLKNNIATWKAMNGVGENKQAAKNNTSKVILVEKKVDKKKDRLNLKLKPIDTLEAPPAQKQFLNIVVKAQSSSISATNDMQRGGFLSTRSRKLCDLLRTIDFSPNNWIGTIDDVNSNSDGKGVLYIKLATDVFLKTSNNSFSDIGSNTLLEPTSPIFIAVAEMVKGDKVKFSGNFFTQKPHCIYEKSLSLRGKISEPEFKFKFSKVYKINKK